MKKKGKYVFDNSSLAERRYRRARGSLLLLILITVLNTVMAATGNYESYYVFCDYLAYYCAVYGRVFYEESGDMLYLILGCAAVALILLPLLLCWIFSKKRRGWMIAALVMVSLDTLLIVVDAIGYRDISYLLSIAFHIWLIVEMVLAIRAGKEAIAEMNEPKPAVQDTEFHDASVITMPDTAALGMPQEERKYRVIVEAMYGSRTIQVRRSYGLTELVIDGRLYGKWEGVAEMPYRLTARVDGHEIATALQPNNVQTIEVDGEIVAKKFRLR